MRVLLKLLLLCLLAAKPWTSNGQVTEVYPGEATEEVIINIFDEAYSVYPPGTVVEYAPSTPTHDWWFNISHGSLSTNSYDEGITIETLGCDTFTYTNQHNEHEFPLYVTIVESNRTEEISWSSSDNGVAYVKSNSVSFLKGSTPVMLTASSDGCTRRMEMSGGVIYPIFPTEDVSIRSIDAGSAKKGMRTEALALISGKDPDDISIRNQFSTMDHTATNYVRNSQFWLKDIDLTCVSVWNSTGDGSLVTARGLPSGNFRTATAITPMHIISANHYHMRQTWSGSSHPIPPTVRFVTADNQVIERQVVSHTEITSNTNLFFPRYFSEYQTEQYSTNKFKPDIVLMRLDSPLPSTIVPAKYLPSDFLDYLPRYLNIRNYMNNKFLTPNLPVYAFDAARDVRLGESIFDGFYSKNEAGYFKYGYYFYLSRYYEFDEFDSNEDGWFWKDSENGDSSTPTFYIINDQAVLNSTHTYSSGGFPHAYVTDDIQDQINDWGDTNQLSFVDLSEFDAYEEEYRIPTGWFE